MKMGYNNLFQVSRILLPIQSFFQTLEWYELGMQTGSYSFSGTTSNIFVRIVCNNGTSPVYWLQDPNKPSKIIFVTDSIVFFLVPLPKHIGKPIGVHIWYEETGEQPSWFLDTVIVRNIVGELDQSTVYSFKRWLSNSLPNSKPYAHISFQHSAEDGAENQSMSRCCEVLRFRILKACIKEYHSWIGIFTSSPISRFSKQRRVIFGLFSILLMSVVIIVIQKNSSTSRFGSNTNLVCFADICLNNYHNFVAFQAVLISLLPRIICCIIFERAENNFQGTDAIDQKIIYKKHNVKKQNKYRRRSALKLPNDNNRGKQRNGNKQRSSFEEPLLSSNGTQNIHNNHMKYYNSQCIKKKPKSRAFKKRILADFKSLPTIPENSIINLQREEKFIPEIHDNLKKLIQRKGCLPRKCGRLLSLMLIITSGFLAFYMWSVSRFWSKMDDRDSLIIVGVSISIDICIAQFFRPIFEYIRLAFASQKVTHLIFGCPLSSLCNVFIDIESSWKTVHRSDNRQKYLRKIYNGRISIPAPRTVSKREKKRNIPKKLYIKELLYCLMFTIVFIIHVWQRIDSEDYFLFRNLQNDLMQLNNSNFGTVVSW